MQRTSSHIVDHNSLPEDTPHLTLEVIGQYVEHKLTPEQRLVVQKHTETCSDCDALLHSTIRHKQRILKRFVWTHLLVPRPATNQTVISTGYLKYEKEKVVLEKPSPLADAQNALRLLAFQVCPDPEQMLPPDYSTGYRQRIKFFVQFLKTKSHSNAVSAPRTNKVAVFRDSSRKQELTRYWAAGNLSPDMKWNARCVDGDTSSGTLQIDISWESPVNNCIFLMALYQSETSETEIIVRPLLFQDLPLESTEVLELSYKESSRYMEEFSPHESSKQTLAWRNWATQSLKNCNGNRDLQRAPLCKAVENIHAMAQAKLRG